MEHVAHHSSTDAIKSDNFLAKHRSAIKKLALSDFFFESSGIQVIELKQHVKESFLPFLSSTKLSESEVKNTYFCRSTGREESKNSNFSMIRSVALSHVTSATKEIEELKNRKIKNDEVPCCAHG